MKITYHKPTHTFSMTVFDSVIICLTHGVPGDWWHYSDDDGFMIRQLTGFQFATKGNGFRSVGYVFFILWLHVSWYKQDHKKQQ